MVKYYSLVLNDVVEVFDILRVVVHEVNQLGCEKHPKYDSAHQNLRLTVNIGQSADRIKHHNPQQNYQSVEVELTVFLLEPVRQNQLA